MNKIVLPTALFLFLVFLLPFVKADCVYPTDSMTIYTDTVFCTGDYDMNDTSISLGDSMTHIAGVTLDCNDSLVYHTIYSDTIIAVVNASDMTIKNCRISGGSIGIQTMGTDTGLTIENVNVTDSGDYEILIAGRDNVHLKDVNLSWVSSSPSNSLRLYSSSDIYIENLYFTKPIYLANDDNVTIINSKADLGGGSGIYSGNSISNVTIRNTEFNNANKGLDIGGNSYTFTNWLFDNFNVTGATLEAINFWGDGTKNNITIMNSHFANTGGNAVNIQGNVHGVTVTDTSMDTVDRCFSDGETYSGTRTDVTLININCQNTKNSGISFTIPVNTLIDNVYCYNITGYACVGLEGDYFTYVNGVTVRNIYSETNVDGGGVWLGGLADGIIDNVTLIAPFTGGNAGIGGWFVDNVTIKNSYVEGGGIAFSAGSNIVVENNNVSNTAVAKLDFVNDSIIIDNSDNVVIRNNVVSGSNATGIYIDMNGGSNVLVYNNELIDNSIQAMDVNGEADWNTTYTCVGTNIIGGDCSGGNYWSDYVGVDYNGDGIGDTNVPYVISSGDYLPLTNNGVVIPVIYITSPADLSNTTDHTPDFTFNFTNSLENMSCELLINGTGYGIDSMVLNSTNTVITANQTLGDGYYVWLINCTHDIISANSNARALTVYTEVPPIPPSPPITGGFVLIAQELVAVLMAIGALAVFVGELAYGTKDVRILIGSFVFLMIALTLAITMAHL